jgi:hypothetical protein
MHRFTEEEVEAKMDDAESGPKWEDAAPLRDLQSLICEFMEDSCHRLGSCKPRYLCQGFLVRPTIHAQRVGTWSWSIEAQLYVAVKSFGDGLSRFRAVPSRTKHEKPLFSYRLGFPATWFICQPSVLSSKISDIWQWHSIRRISYIQVYAACCPFLLPAIIITEYPCLFGIKICHYILILTSPSCI